MTAFFSFLILIFSVVIHEVCHGLAALSQGDKTAKYQGRLTLNPIAHIDIVGSVIVPILLAILPGGLMFGWAKPVPINPYNFRNQRWGELFVAAAGPFSNLVLATLAGLTIRLFGEGLPTATVSILAIVTITNIVLAIFNLVPVPPLDGSKILFGLLPQKWAHFREAIERHGIWVTLLFVFFIWQFFTPFILFVFKALTGVGI